jgi:hypothetical protein
MAQGVTHGSSPCYSRSNGKSLDGGDELLAVMLSWGTLMHYNLLFIENPGRLLHFQEHWFLCYSHFFSSLGYLLVGKLPRCSI